MSLATFVNLTEGVGITITGLRGTKTLRTDDIALTITDVALSPWVNFAEWDQTTGSLFLIVAPGRTMHANRLYGFTFVLHNPAVAQQAQTAYIYSTQVYVYVCLMFYVVVPRTHTTCSLRCALALCSSHMPKCFSSQTPHNERCDEYRLSCNSVVQCKWKHTRP